MAFTFFFSYARANRWNCERQNLVTGETSNLLDQLFDELVSLVHDDLGGDRSLIGYRDVEELRVGDPWPQRLSEAICKAKVLVTVFTPSYFQSINCGREFNVFLTRVEQHRARSGGGVRTPIVPVFWTDEPSCRRGNYDPINRYLRDIQYRQQGMPARYPSEGCRRLMDLRQQDYRSLTYAVKDAVCDLARCDLAALEGAGNFHELPSAFLEEFVELTLSHTICPLPGELQRAAGCLHPSHCQFFMPRHERADAPSFL